MSPRRIFCIGFNKTGTTSLHEAFRSLGYDSHHGMFWPHFSWDRSGKCFFDNADCFSDGEYSNYANLDTWFPEAIFILNYREERAWLRSRVKHFLAMEQKAEETFGGKGLEAIRPHRFRHIEMSIGPDLSIDRWIATRRLYHNHVRTYFDGRGNFMELDVTSECDWPQRLAEFLERHGEPIDSSRPLLKVHANARPDESACDPKRLAYLFDLVDDRLLRYGR